MAATTQGGFLQEGVWRQEWPTLNGEIGNPASLSKWPTKSIQVIGAGSAEIQGSNDGVNWSALNDSIGIELGDVTPVTAANIRDVLQNTAFIRPVATGAAQVIIIAM